MPRQLENWLRSYMHFTRHLEAPDHYHFWAGVATIAGALRGKVWYDMEHFRWKPNFFIIYVAPPGIATKSTTIGVGMGLLRQIEGVHFGPESTTWQAITNAFAESTCRVPFPGGDFKMSAITVVASELGTFLDPTNREMIDVLTDLWDGREVPWKRATKGEGEYEIPNPWFNLIGATTPSWIGENFNDYTIGGGFASRTIILFADRKRHLEPYPRLRVKPSDRNLRDQLIADLKEIGEMVGPFELTDDAVAWGAAWYEAHWQGKRAAHLNHPQMQGYVARKQTHMHKLAMVLSAAEGCDMLITLEQLQNANHIIEQIESFMVQAYAKVGDNFGAKNLDKLLAILRAVGKPVPRELLWRNVSGFMQFRDFEHSLLGAQQAGFIRLLQEGQTIIVLPLPSLLQSH